MKIKNITLAVVLLLSVSCAAFADRQMDRPEILQILQQLTSQPKKTWIPAGTIKATREEYRAPKVTDSIEIKNQISQKIAEYQSNPNKQELTKNLQKMKFDAIPFNVRYELANEHTMNSTVIVRFDGDRFYWEINVDSRTDSVKPDKDLAGNFMTEQFNLDWNTRRIFAWDGEKYITYSLPGNHAIVDSTGETPHIVNGPLTTGIIPWGYGFYSYDSLAAAEPSAIEKIIDGRTQLHLTLNSPNGSQMLFVMDPARDYTVLSCLIETGSVAISKQYSDYQLVSGNWVPAVILLERFEAGTNRLLARDLWNITAIDGSVPEAGSFDIEYEEDALLEYFSPLTDKPVMYRYSKLVDTDRLLTGRLAYAAAEGIQPQNCATAALKYALSQLGIDVTDGQLARLATEPDNNTSLLAMKQSAESLGLHCRAVTTDIATLTDLEDCQVILHIPGKKHFVVLESIDSSYVRIIDFTKRKFYYRTDINFFGMDWPDGMALLISNNPIAGEFADIDDEQLAGLRGATFYDCNVLRQNYDVIYCSYIGGECGGYYRTFYERWGCGAAESGSCSQSRMIRYRKCFCIEHPYDPFACTVTGEWTYYYMRACA